MKELWAITTYFNPAGYNSLLNNYLIFKEHLKQQGVPLITVECAFGNSDFMIPHDEHVYRLRANSVLWQKERLINYGVSKLPLGCKYYAWLDCDIIFANPDWYFLAVEKLQQADIIQLFKRVVHLPPGHLAYDGSSRVLLQQGVIWQKMVHKNWLLRRMRKDLPFSTPGFAWAVRRDFFEDIGGIYDRNIIGSGDTFLVDCLLDSWEIHGFYYKFTSAMRGHMLEWADRLRAKNPRIDYIPTEIWHLWHGSLRNRRYVDRHDILQRYQFDPRTDIRLVNDVYEWASDKKGMHDEIRQYFFDRKEDVEE